MSYYTYANSIYARQYAWQNTNQLRFQGRNPKQGTVTHQHVRKILIEKKSKDVSSVYNSVTGARVILNKNVSFFRRVIWFFIVVICSGLCLYQVGDRFVKYLENPITMNIEIMRNRTVKYPSFTICPFDIDSMAAIRKAQFDYAEISKNMTLHKVWYLLDYANFTTSQIWDLNQIDETNTNVSFVMKKTLPTEHFPTIEKIPRRFAFLGVCMTIKVAGSVNFMGPAFVMRIEREVTPDVNFNDDASFTIYPHEDNTPALHHAFFKGQIIPRGYTISIALSVTTFKSINTTSKPCQDSITSTTCWTRCLEAILTSKTKCRLPFMTSKARNCTTAIESMEVYEATLNMYLTTKPSQCNCPPKCVDIDYEMDLDIQQNSCNITMLEIYFQENNFQQISEVYMYGFVSFVCDMGGNLGFYLGFCLLTLLEMIEQFIDKFRNVVPIK